MSNNALWIILQKLRIPLLVIIVTYSIAILGMVLIPGMDDDGKVYHLTFFDAFYFVSYMASTIGFGESPYTFTYAQRIWVSFCIYLTVVGWFYGIGALVSALTNKTLKFELMKNRFKKQVHALRGEFVIVLGYSYVTVEIIKKLLDQGLEVVLIDEDEDRMNHFLLEDFSKHVPTMVGDGLITDTLKDAGIEQNNCYALVALFEKEDKNLRASILTKFLNPNVQVVAKSTIYETTNSLIDTDITKVINPFEVFAKRLDIALSSPHILILENWMYGNSDLYHEALFLPKGKYIICGYGRLGKLIQEKLEKHGIEYVFIDSKRVAKREMIKNEQFLKANPDDKDILCGVGIKEASTLIAGTVHDIDNLSIMITARKLNPKIYLIARENTMDEVSIFQAANIDWLFMIEKIIINKTSMFLANPVLEHFLALALKQNEIWGKMLVKELRSRFGSNPQLMSLTIDREEAYAIVAELSIGKEINIEVLLYSLIDQSLKHKAMPLLLIREGKCILLPHKISLKLGDKLLFACDEESREEIELIASNIYELYYVMYGEEKESSWLLKKLFRYGSNNFFRTSSEK